MPNIKPNSLVAPRKEDDSFIKVRRQEDGMIIIVFPQPCHGIMLDAESALRVADKIKSVATGSIVSI